VSADGSLFVTPPGKSPEQLYQTLVVLITTLNRIKTADATDLTAVNQALGEAQQQINDLWEAVESGGGGGGLTAQQAWELSLVTAVDTMLGSVSNAVLESIKQSQKAAEATIRSLLQGQNNKVAIRVEQQARLTEREAFASQVETVLARLGLAEASITTETTARTNADNALSLVDQNITTALNGNIAQLNILATSIDGIEQKFAVTLNENGQVTGLVQLDGSPAGTNFTVVADKFQVAQPNETGGAPKPVFLLGDIAGTPTLVFHGDMFGDGTITANKLNAASIATLYIADPTNTYYYDFANGAQGRTDGTFLIDAKNRLFKVSSS